MTKPSAVTIVGAMTVLLVAVPAVVLGVLEVRQARRAPDLVVAVSSWPAARLAHSAEYFHYFDKHGLNVKIVDLGNDINGPKKALGEGQADGAILELAEALSLAAAGTSVDMVMVTSHSNGAVGLVGSTSVPTLEELKGKRVAYEAGGSDELLLSEALSRVGLGLNDIISVKSSSAESVQMYINNQLDAVVVREPYLRQVLSKINSRLMFSSRDVPGLLPDVLAFRSDYTAAHRAAVSAYVTGWFDMVNEMDKDDEMKRQILAIVAIKGGMSSLELSRQLDEIKIYNVEDNVATYSDDAGNMSLNSSAYRFLALQTAERNMPPLNLNEIIEPYFIRQMSAGRD